VNVAGTRALPDPPAGPADGELPPPDEGWALTPPDPEVVGVLVGAFDVVLGLLVVVLGVLLGVVAAVGVLDEVAVLETSGALAVLELVVACVEPPHPATASTASNAPESWFTRLTFSA
jgi:hypothetical protein